MVADRVEILLVEDNAHDVELALRALRKTRMGSRVEIARDGEEALDFIYARGKFADRDANERPRVVLLDLKLPKVDGLEVLRILKSDPVTRSIPVVILTSSREDRDVTESYQLGVNSYIGKPVDFEQFSEAVRHLEHYWLRLNESPRS